MPLESNNNNSNKRKMEGGSFEEKVSIVLNDLAGFSDFCIKPHKVSHCPVQDCKVGKFIIKLDFLLKRQRSLDKATFIDLCNDYPEPSKTMFDCSLRKKYCLKYFSRLSEK